jgi:hypothetical protein
MKKPRLLVRPADCGSVGSIVAPVIEVSNENAKASDKRGKRLNTQLKSKTA